MVFGECAQYYDAIYAEKDYAAECDFLEGLFSEYAAAPVRHILDLGCGTGGHTIPLARRGYRLTGVDRSDGMLTAAREKAARAGVEPDFHQGDLRSLELGRTFEAVIAMFAVMSYQTSNADLTAALRSARRHLQIGGLLVFDVWYGPAVLAQRPADRYRIIENDEERIVRLVQPALDMVTQTVAVRYKLIRLRGAQLVDETEEVHVMRFLFAQEIDYLLSTNGFRLLKLGPFMALDRPLTEEDWNVMVVADVA